MSGHSKWATTKRQKAATDAKKGAVFTKLSNLITVAAREKGGDPAVNFSLRLAVDKARTANMPKDNIDRAIKRGTGELAGEQIVELIYEGFGPAKSQFIVKCLTDNKNRSAAEVRHIFNKHGGAFGSVRWNFDKLGLIRVVNENLEKYNTKLRINANTANCEYANKEAGEDFELELISEGTQDIIKEEEGITLIMNIEDLQKVKNFLDAKNIETESAEIEYVAKEKQDISAEEKENVEKFIADLENLEDVSDYYTNINI